MYTDVGASRNPAMYLLPPPDPLGSPTTLCTGSRIRYVHSCYTSYPGGRAPAPCDSFFTLEGYHIHGPDKGRSRQEGGRMDSLTILAGLFRAAVAVAVAAALAAITGTATPLPRLLRRRHDGLRLLLTRRRGRRRRHRLPRRARVVAVDVAQVPAGLDGVAHAPLQLLGLGEPAVDGAVPEHAVLDPGRRGGLGLGLGRRVGRVSGRVRGGSGRGEEQLDDERAPRRGLQRHFPQRRREGRQELLRELWRAAGAPGVSGGRFGQRSSVLSVGQACPGHGTAGRDEMEGAWRIGKNTYTRE